MLLSKALNSKYLGSAFTGAFAPTCFNFIKYESTPVLLFVPLFNVVSWLNVIERLSPCSPPQTAVKFVTGVGPAADFEIYSYVADQLSPTKSFNS